MDILYIIIYNSVGDRAWWICDGTAMRSSSKHFPRYDCFEGTWSRKMRFFLLYKFYLNRPQMRANVFYNRCRKDLNDAIKLIHHEARHAVNETERPWWSVFDRLRATHASLNNRHLMDWSILYRAMWLDAINDMGTEHAARLERVNFQLVCDIQAWHFQLVCDIQAWVR